MNALSRTDVSASTKLLSRDVCIERALTITVAGGCSQLVRGFGVEDVSRYQVCLQTVVHA